MIYAFYVSGRSGRLKKFLQQADAKILEQINIVVSDSGIDTELENELNKHKIPLKVFQRCQLSGISNKEKNKQFSDLLLRELKACHVDYCFSFGSHILAGEILQEYLYRIINFHLAILPMFPGQKAIDQAVRHGNIFLLGNTAHFIDEGVDTGLVIMQSVLPMQHFYDTGFNYDVVLDLQIQMLNKLIQILNDNCLEIENGKVHIKNADYSQSSIWPAYFGGVKYDYAAIWENAA